MARVLVVDDDLWTQRMVSSVLSHDGHTVDLASDGWEALIRAGRAKPDLIIVEAQLPTTDGWKLVETLRSRPELAHVPALFLTSFTNDGRRTPGFREGVDETIAKPFRLEDLEARVAGMLGQLQMAPGTDQPHPRPITARQLPTLAAAGRRTPPFPLPSLGPGVRLMEEEMTPTRRAALAGWLDLFPLASVLMLLELERKSGVVVVTSPAGAGRVFLRDGRVVRAELEMPARAAGAEAVFQMLTWAEGRFEFNAAHVDVEDEIRSPTSYLLMESARLEDERRQQKKTQN